MIATRSPFPTPRAARPPAIRPVRVSKSTNVVVRSCSTKAVFSGVAATAAPTPNGASAMLASLAHPNWREQCGIIPATHASSKFWGGDNSGCGEIVERLGLQPHPEGGMYAETWRAGRNRRAREWYCDLLPAPRGRAVALASRRCDRDLALLRGRSTRAADECRRSHDGDALCSARTSRPDTRRSSSWHRTCGRPHDRSARGRSSAAPSHPGSPSTASSSRRQGGHLPRPDLQSLTFTSGSKPCDPGGLP